MPCRRNLFYSLLGVNYDSDRSLQWLESMRAVPRRGDVLIRASGASYELVDAVTHDLIAVAETFQEALAIAARHRAAVWHANVDDRRRPSGEPVLVLPNIFE